MRVGALGGLWPGSVVAGIPLERSKIDKVIAALTHHQITKTREKAYQITLISAVPPAFRKSKIARRSVMIGNRNTHHSIACMAVIFHHSIACMAVSVHHSIACMAVSVHHSIACMAVIVDIVYPRATLGCYEPLLPGADIAPFMSTRPKTLAEAPATYLIEINLCSLPIVGLLSLLFLMIRRPPISRCTV